MKLILLALLPLTAYATGVPSERTIREECSAFSEAGMRECVAKKAQESENTLAEAEKASLAALSKWDEDAKLVQLAKKRLRASSVEFTKYREAQCAFLSSTAGGAIGNALEIKRLACAAELNFQRAAQLSQ